MPSLAQLDQAVREFLTENPDDVVTVVVDASFGHRIDSSESKMFEEAEEAGELVSPPAGAIGRGDAFLLRIADKTGATVLSNDSFQEFHGDYDWLFERGRLIGGKPVPGVGWIFTPRTPVRGPRSREAVKEAKRKTTKEPESTKPGLDLAAERSRAKGQGKGKKNVERAIAVALEEAVAPKDKPHRRRKGGSPPADPVNSPLSFITFIAAHPLGAEVMATVESFASHGAFVDCQGARCYVPLSAMGNPPPKSARELFTKGQEVRFVVQALDPQRRGVELAIPGFAKIAGAPTDETVAAEIEGQAEDEAEALAAVAAPPARRSRKKAAPAPEPALAQASEAPLKKAAPRRRAPAAPAEVASMQAAPQQAPTPSRRSPRRRVAPKESVEVAPQESVEAASGGAVGAASAPIPGPPRRAPRRRATSVAPEESVAVSPSAAVEDEAPAPAALAPRRRGSRQEQPAEPAAALPADPSGAAPRARRGQTRGAATAEPIAPEPAPAASPVRRRRAAAAAAPEPVAAAPEPVPAASTSRRRRVQAAPAAEPVETPDPVPTAARARRRRAPEAPAVEAVAPAPEPVPAASTSRRRRAPAAPADEPAEPVVRAKRARAPQRPPA